MKKSKSQSSSCEQDAGIAKMIREMPLERKIGHMVMGRGLELYPAEVKAMIARERIKLTA